MGRRQYSRLSWSSLEWQKLKIDSSEEVKTQLANRKTFLFLKVSFVKNLSTAFGYRKSVQEAGSLWLETIVHWLLMWQLVTKESLRRRYFEWFLSVHLLFACHEYFYVKKISAFWNCGAILKLFRWLKVLSTKWSFGQVHSSVFALQSCFFIKHRPFKTRKMNSKFELHLCSFDISFDYVFLIDIFHFVIFLSS